MKKALSIVLAALMLLSGCLSLSSCQDQAAGGNFKVGAIYINGKNDTAGYTFAHANGIKKAVAACGLSEDDLIVIDNVREDDIEVGNAIDTLANQGCNIIFGISFGYITAFDSAAKNEKYKDIIFSHATGYKSSLDGDDYKAQFNNYFGRIYQARYLAGIAAGLKSLEMKNNNIGYVSAYGTQYAETCSGINGFTLGVLSVNPEAKVYVQEIGNWADETLEAQIAKNLIDTYNCCVIAQHCDSAQPQIVATNNGVYGCGYNSDMSDKAANHLTAPIWNWDVYYTKAIKTAMEKPEKFMEEVGIYYGGLVDNFVDVSPLSDKCAANTDKIVPAVKDLMKSGEWDVFSGVKLTYQVGEDGKVDITKTDAALVDNKGATLVEAGQPSVDDGVIKGSMNYYVQGVVEVK